MTSMRFFYVFANQSFKIRLTSPVRACIPCREVALVIHCLKYKISDIGPIKIGFITTPSRELLFQGYGQFTHRIDAVTQFAHQTDAVRGTPLI
jgi:hypothetical protein